MQDQPSSPSGGAGRLGRPPNPLDPATSRRAELGAEVRRLRAARGLSLDALAKLVHCSSSHLSEVENGKKLPSVGLIQNLDRVLETAGEDQRTLRPRSTTRPGSYPGRATTMTNETGQPIVARDRPSSLRRPTPHRGSRPLGGMDTEGRSQDAAGVGEGA